MRNLHAISDRHALGGADASRRADDPDAPEALLDLIYNTGQKRDKNRHHWMYSERSLRRLLLELGFSEVDRSHFGEGLWPDRDRLDDRAEESLFMEGVT